MAGPGTEQYGGNPLFVAPDHLMLQHVPINPFRGEGQRQNTYGEGHAPSTHHQAVWVSQQAQHPRPMLPLHSSSISEWAISTQNAFRNNLPPTPVSPFRPLRPLSEDERLAFPCTGSYSDCWNTDLCPKHRQDVKPEQPPTINTAATTTTIPPEFSQQTQPGPNPRRRSAPAGDVKPPPAKMKRNATDPEEADLNISCRYHSHTTIGRDARSSVSKGRVPHNLVERRYRDNLNNQIEALRLTLPSLRDAQPSSAADLEDTSSPRMPSKAVIISTAATYIKDIENERTRLLAANSALQEQISSLQKLMRCDDCNVVQYLNTLQLHHSHLPTPS